MIMLWECMSELLGSAYAESGATSSSEQVPRCATVQSSPWDSAPHGPEQ